MLRRLLQLHPEVHKMFHEQFILKRYNNKKALIKYINSLGIKDKTDNWGEKVPYYPSARKYPIVKYCETWNDYFGDKARILHVVRHPYDIANSTVKKFRHIKTTDHPIRIFKKIIKSSVTKIDQMDSSFTFKYEDLLTDPDRIMYEIYKHCGLTPDIDYKSKMQSIKNKRYQNINPDRAFSYKNDNKKWNYDLKEEIEILNKINGTKYEL